MDFGLLGLFELTRFIMPIKELFQETTQTVKLSYTRIIIFRLEVILLRSFIFYELSTSGSSSNRIFNFLMK